MEKVWLKNYPSNVPHEIPKIDKILNAMFLEACEEFKDKPSFINFDKSISYFELKQLSLQLAAYLQSVGLKKGDKIALQLPNLIQYPVSFWASMLSGLTVVNMNPLYTSSEMLAQLKDAEVDAIILLSSSAKPLESILPELNLKTIIITQPGDLLNFPKKQIVNFVFKYIQKKSKNYKIPTCISFTKALNLHPAKKTIVINRELEEVIFIQYTGGTTGKSKGACLTQRNIISNLKQCELQLKAFLNKGEGMGLTPLPLYHVFSFLVNGLLFFTYGITNVLITDPRKISTVINSIKKYPIIVGTGVNTLFKALAENPEFKKIDFSNWKFFVSGGMALEHQTQKLWKKITGSSIIEGYGLTEASPVVCVNDLNNLVPGSIGFPLSSTEIRITDEQGKELGFNQDGELELRGPQVMKGYYKNKEETQKVLSADGWLKTGDVACVNEKGLVFIRDRKKDMINISGLKVYPNQIEDILTRHEKISEAAVIGIKDERCLELVKAFIVKKDTSLTEQEVKNYCKQHLASYKIPKQIEFLDSIPKTNIGKNLRRALRQS